MLVVKTTSATAGSVAASAPPAIRPRKRVPSSRRRNPGSVTRVSAANLFLRCGRRRVGVRSCRRRRGRSGLERNGGRGSRRRRSRGRRTKPLFQNRAGSRGVGRHYLQDEAQTEEDPARPPGGLGKKISRLANSDECVRGRARTA